MDVKFLEDRAMEGAAGTVVTKSDLFLDVGSGSSPRVGLLQANGLELQLSLEFAPDHRDQPH